VYDLKTTSFIPAASGRVPYRALVELPAPPWRFGRQPSCAGKATGKVTSKVVRGGADEMRMNREGGGRAVSVRGRSGWGAIGGWDMRGKLKPG
jgi:hypothetical protein